MLAVQLNSIANLGLDRRLWPKKPRMENSSSFHHFRLAAY
jgi:hypothetical protein